MRITILSFALGAWVVQQLAALPNGMPLALCAAVACGLGVLSWQRFRARPRLARVCAALAGGLAGFVWAAGFAAMRLNDALPHDSEGRDIQVTGVVATLPQRYGSGVRFEFEVEQSSLPTPRRVWLSWYAGTGEDEASLGSPVHPGERWQLTVRMKRPRGNANPHGFDFEALLFERGVRASGYVRASHENLRRAEFVPGVETAIERAREQVRSRIDAVLGDAEFSGVIQALVMGDQRAIEQDFWTLFNRTGITHLMAISGFHITMIAALLGALVGALWRRVPALALRVPAQKVAVLAGFVAALAYCLIAGMGVPSQRTLCMLSVGAAALWLDRMTSPSRVLMLALAVVLMLDPTSVNAAGFWLSFGAVGVLMFACSGRVAGGHWLRDAVQSQWAVTVGLLPVLLALFGQFSVVSPIANAIAIPVVSFVVTPLALAGAFLHLDWLLVASHQVLAWMMVPMEWLAQLPWAVWQSHAPAPWVLVLSVAGCVVAMLPRGFPLRMLGLVMLLPLVWVVPPRVSPGLARVTVLDVGQGLAVHVQTAQHDLLFDTGPQFSEDANSGNRIIVPYLRAMGVGRLDAMVISHEDRDHSGGVHSVAESMPIAQVIDSLPADSLWRPEGLPAKPCAAGDEWVWEGVRFEILNPPAGPAVGPRDKRNDRSCVLRVSANGQRVLISADIEAPAELALVAQQAEHLRAQVLIAPHHGSRTSSTPEFLRAVAPQVVVFPVGYRNRYRHPNHAVWLRYRDTGATLLRTDRDGALRWTLGGNAPIERVRDSQRRYWNDTWDARRDE